MGSEVRNVEGGTTILVVNGIFLVNYTVILVGLITAKNLTRSLLSNDWVIMAAWELQFLNFSVLFVILVYTHKQFRVYINGMFSFCCMNAFNS